MTYLEGWRENTTPSRRHEVSKKQIARLLELFCLERNIPLYGYGSTTFRKEEKQRGLEPDECYSREADRDLPDVAIEVVVSSPALDRLEVYAGRSSPTSRSSAWPTTPPSPISITPCKRSATSYARGRKERPRKSAPATRARTTTVVLTCGSRARIVIAMSHIAYSVLFDLPLSSVASNSNNSNENART